MSTIDPSAQPGIAPPHRTSETQELAALDAAAAAVPKSPLPGPVLQVVRELTTKLPPSKARQRSLNQLSGSEPLVVVTGQQPGLFLGPLLTLYKALSAVRYARLVAERTGRPTVPIFWLQTEDHDFEEVHAALFYGGGVPGSPSANVERFALTTPPKSERSSLAYYRFGPEITEQVSRLEAQFGGGLGEPLLKIIRESHRPGALLAEAFMQVLAALTEEDGLLFFDPRHPAVPPLAANIYHTALQEDLHFAQLLTERAEALRAAGEEVQVHVRERAPLFFFHPDGETGPRFRLEAMKAGHYSLVGSTGTITKAELARLLETHPEQFSASALIRPLVQDHLFPTVCYVGGPAELRYLRQLPPLYAAFGRSQPAMVPRAQLSLLDRRAERLLKELAIAPEELAADDLSLAAQIRGRRAADGIPSAEELAAESQQQLESLMAKLRSAIEGCDPTLLRPLEKTRGAMEGSLTALLARYTRAYAERDQVTVERIRKLKELLYPDGTPQERVYSPLGFLLEYGSEALHAIRKAIQPFATGIHPVSLVQGEK